MQIETENRHGIVIVRPLDSRLDARASDVFREKLKTLADHGAKRVVIDLDHVDFMDSSGLSAIVSALKFLGADGNIAVCEAKGSVSRMFRLSRADKIFSMASNVSEAVTMLASS